MNPSEEKLDISCDHNHVYFYCDVNRHSIYTPLKI